MHRLRLPTIVLAALLGAGALLVTVPQASAGVGDPATGSTFSLPGTAVVLRVDGSVPATTYYPHTDVWPTGTVEHPYPDIATAVAGSKWLRQRGTAARIVVAPGVYREKIEIGWAGDAAPALLVEPEVPGTVTVSGADLESRWTPVSGTGYFSAPWTEKWGMSPVPSSWSGVSVPDMVRRREAVFVDGKSLMQVATTGQLVAGSFAVDETAGRLYMMPPAGVTKLSQHRIEVARRDAALRIHGLARSVAVRGLTFEGAAAPLEKHMAYVSSATNILIEANTFRNSAAGGFGLAVSTDVTVRNNLSVDNGANGLDTYNSRNVVIEGNRIAGNNVRGLHNGFVGWSRAGSKNFVMHGAVFRNNTYEGNFARGLWFDTDITNVLVDGDRAVGNLLEGLFIESVQGPVTVRGALYEGNGGGGVVLGTASRVTVEGSTLQKNRYGQLVISGSRTRSFTSLLDGRQWEVKQVDDLSLVGNTFTSEDSVPLIYSPAVTIADWKDALARGEVAASGNVFRRSSEYFAIKIQNTDFPLSDWRAATGDSAQFVDLSEEPVVSEPPAEEPPVEEPPVEEPPVEEPKPKGNGGGKKPLSTAK